MLPTWVVSLLQAGRITRYTAIIETPEYPNIHFSILISRPYFLLSFDWSLSCKLQLIDLIMVSAACLAVRQTILKYFFPRTVKWVRRKSKETNGWKIKNASGRFIEQIHPSRFVSEIICPVRNVAIEECFFYIYFTSVGYANTIISRHACVIIRCPKY